jgi:hypothetical protein
MQYPPAATSENAVSGSVARAAARAVGTSATYSGAGARVVVAAIVKSLLILPVFGSSEALASGLLLSSIYWLHSAQFCSVMARIPDES